MHLTPAAYVIRTFGGVRKTARIIGRDPSSVSMWNKSREDRGTDGNIPSLAQHKILEEAKALGLDITPDDLILGREVNDE